MFGSPYFGATHYGPRYFPRGTSTFPTYTSLEESLVAELRQSPSVTALLGTYQGAVGVYADDRPQGAALPAIVYFISGAPRLHHLDGRGRVADARMTIEVHGKTRAQVRALADVLVPLLCDKSTPFRLGGGGVTVLEVLLDDEQGGYAPAGDGTDQPFRWIVLDFSIRYREAV